jgi:GDP-L-fucose synthase
LAKAILVCLEKYDSDQHINIGTGEDLSIRELAIKVAKAAGFEGEIIWDASKPDGTPRKVLDVSKIMSLGWKPSITLDQGISETVQWYQENK